MDKSFLRPVRPHLEAGETIRVAVRGSQVRTAPLVVGFFGGLAVAAPVALALNAFVGTRFIYVALAVPLFTTRFAAARSMTPAGNPPFPLSLQSVFVATDRRVHVWEATINTGRRHPLVRPLGAIERETIVAVRPDQGLTEIALTGGRSIRTKMSTKDARLLTEYLQAVPVVRSPTAFATAPPERLPALAPPPHWTSAGAPLLPPPPRPLPPPGG